MLKALTIPLTSAIARMCQTVTTPRPVSPASRKASSIKPVCVQAISQRRSTRSARTPPQSEKIRNGIDWAKPTAPSMNVEPVSW